MSAIRVGVIGAGTNTKGKHIPLLQALDGVEVVVVCNRSPESSRNVADQFGIKRIAATWLEVVTAADVDAVVIGTWPYMHKDITVAALAAGKHVLTEARMAMNAAEAQTMLTASRARPDLTAMIVPSPFSLKWDATVQKYLADGRLGELLYVDVGCAAGKWLDTVGGLTWRQSAEYSGHNTMMMGILYEAVRRWVGDVTKVQAMSRTFVKSRVNVENGQLEAVKIPDHVDVLGELAGGAQMHMVVSDVARMSDRPKMVFMLCGTTGELHLDVVAKKVTFYEKDGTGVKETVLQDADFSAFPTRAAAATDGVAAPPGWRVEEEFVNAIRGVEKVKRTRFEDGVNYMQFTEAVAISAAEGKAVTLPLLPSR